MTAGSCTDRHRVTTAEPSIPLWRGLGGQARCLTGERNGGYGVRNNRRQLLSVIFGHDHVASDELAGQEGSGRALQVRPFGWAASAWPSGHTGDGEGHESPRGACHDGPAGAAGPAAAEGSARLRDIDGIRRRHDELAGRDPGARDAATEGRRPLSAAEYLKIIALGGVLARLCVNPSWVHRAVPAGASWEDIALSRNVSEEQAREDYRGWAAGQHGLHRAIQGAGLDDAGYAAALERADAPPWGCTARHRQEHLAALRAAIRSRLAALTGEEAAACLDYLAVQPGTGAPLAQFLAGRATQQPGQ